MFCDPPTLKLRRVMRAKSSVALAKEEALTRRKTSEVTCMDNFRFGYMACYLKLKTTIPVLLSQGQSPSEVLFAYPRHLFAYSENILADQCFSGDDSQ